LRKTTAKIRNAKETYTPGFVKNFLLLVVAAPSSRGIEFWRRKILRSIYKTRRKKHELREQRAKKREGEREREKTHKAKAPTELRPPLLNVLLLLLLHLVDETHPVPLTFIHSCLVIRSRTRFLFVPETKARSRQTGGRAGIL
jgi:hypothetical protein